MTKKYCTFAGWFLFAACILAAGAERGYGDDLYKASLTGSSLSSYDRKVEGKISIKDNGKVELSIKGLRSYPDNKLVSQNCTLVIETEVNDNSKTYSETFLITDGDAELEFTLQDLEKDDKLEITSVAINKSTSTTPTPTASASPTPTSSPTANPTVTATPTSTASPTPTSSATPTSIVAQVFHASTTSEDTIMVPGGMISESTTVTTPTPATSPTATASPTATPSVIPADISIKPETLNLKGSGKFKAFIELASPYSVENIDPDTVECSGAKAISGKSGVDKHGRFIATFDVQDLNLDEASGITTYRDRDDKKRDVTLTVSGELKDGTIFEGSDTVKVKGTQRDGDDDDDDDHGKNKHQ